MAAASSVTPGRRAHMAFLMDWCRRDPQMGFLRLESETPEIVQEARERLDLGPQCSCAVWEQLRVMRQAAKEPGQQKGKT